MNENLINKLAEQKILPIIRRKDPNEVIETVNALVKGGIRIVEINVESPEIYSAIKKVSDKVTVCAGGIITSIQANAAILAHASLNASPLPINGVMSLNKTPSTG